MGGGPAASISTSSRVLIRCAVSESVEERLPARHGKRRRAHGRHRRSAWRQSTRGIAAHRIVSCGCSCQWPQQCVEAVFPRRWRRRRLNANHQRHQLPLVLARSHTRRHNPPPRLCAGMALAERGVQRRVQRERDIPPCASAGLSRLRQVHRRGSRCNRCWRRRRGRRPHGHGHGHDRGASTHDHAR